MEGGSPHRRGLATQLGVTGLGPRLAGEVLIVDVQVGVTYSRFVAWDEVTEFSRRISYSNKARKIPNKTVSCCFQPG